MRISYYVWVSFQTLNTLVLNPLTAQIPSLPSFGNDTRELLPVLTPTSFHPPRKLHPSNGAVAGDDIGF